MTTAITIQHTPGCPNAALARQRIEAAFSELGRTPPAIVLEEVAGPDDAARLGFQGSPALLIDGVDHFAPGTGVPAFACRTYATTAGPDGAPSIEQIIAVLDTAEES